MPPPQCHNCHGRNVDGAHKFDSPKLCAGCHKVYYCSKKCQTRDWLRHIFDCKPADVTTAHRLALAVREDLLPQDQQTCEDYGFDRAFSVENRTMLFGLYVGLIKYNDVKPKTLHKWRLQGGATLVREIKRVFERLSPASRGGYYTWFLQHQYILDDSQPQPENSTPEDQASQMRRRAWVFTGGSPSTSDTDITAALGKMPEDRRTCFFFYLFLLARWHPSPSEDMWIHMGFCGCSSEPAEMAFGGLYQELIRRCPFDEFCDAYSNSNIAELFRKKDLPLNVGRMAGKSGDERFIEDALSGSPRVRKSVWDLKALILQLESTRCDSLRVIPSVSVDYGFYNCKNPEEGRQLTEVYKKYFARPTGVDPLALHQAAIEGKLFEHVGQFVKLKPQKLLKRLMKNPYPLPEI
ncbi:hypothetical protein AX16_010104 [Volvariella volvacea WC 439]|nr:hypothetical protein AX16_010104 [Volvariella volvacea WC 439]